MIRSLAFKLTLAFLLVGITGSVVVAVLVGQRTRSEFDRFVSNRDESLFISFLADYYAENGSWEDVSNAINNEQYSVLRGAAVTVVDADGRIIVSGNRNRLYTQLSAQEVAYGNPIKVEDEVVGYLILPAREPSPYNPPPRFNSGNGRSSADPVSAQFLTNVTWAATLSAAIAVLIALVLGLILARTLTKPIRALTAATQAMANGQLGYQVPVTSQDEIGRLAHSFNQMSDDLAKNQQQRRQMTADIAHDLRTPLSLLRGYTEGLKDGRLEGNAKLYNIMFGEVTHLQHLVDDLRTLSLADAGELILNLRPIDPKALLERTGLAHIMQAEEAGITLRIEAPDDLPSVFVDSDRIAQLLSNLVTNALAHTSQGGIVLSAKEADGKVLLSVQDSGSGINAEDLPYIFNRFYRADESRHREDNASSGLGLAIAKAITEAHGGEITAVSTPGEGTTITVQLPVE